jgi:hypothetical protein
MHKVLWPAASLYSAAFGLIDVFFLFFFAYQVDDQVTPGVLAEAPSRLVLSLKWFSEISIEAFGYLARICDINSYTHARLLSHYYNLSSRPSPSYDPSQSMQRCIDALGELEWPVCSLSYFLTALQEVTRVSNSTADDMRALIENYTKAARLSAGVLPQLSGLRDTPLCSLKEPVRPCEPVSLFDDAPELT